MLVLDFKQVEELLLNKVQEKGVLKILESYCDIKLNKNEKTMSDKIEKYLEYNDLEYYKIYKKCSNYEKYKFIKNNFIKIGTECCSSKKINCLCGSSMNNYYLMQYNRTKEQFKIGTECSKKYLLNELTILEKEIKQKELKQKKHLKQYGVRAHFDKIGGDIISYTVKGCTYVGNSYNGNRCYFRVSNPCLDFIQNNFNLEKTYLGEYKLNNSLKITYEKELELSLVKEYYKKIEYKENKKYNIKFYKTKNNLLKII